MIHLITERYEYDYLLKRGVDPLFWHRVFKVDIHLRINIQNNLFGRAELSKKSIIAANDRYYHYCFWHGPLVCENCGKPFFSNKNIQGCYWSGHVSHIISKGAASEMAHDPRNHNKLCHKCHEKWESAKNKEMMIYRDNIIVIEELKRDYNIAI